MKQISELTQHKLFQPEKDTQGITNERQLILKDFLDILNPARKSTGYKPLTGAGIGVKLAHMSNQDLKWFYKKCCNAKSFGGCFWGSLKNK